jgi:hypothetical protein
MNRPLSLALSLLVAFVSALTALAFSDGHDARARGTQPTIHHHLGAHGPAAVTRKELALRNGMRALWEDHVTWTRLGVISLLNDSPDKDATVGRLLRNQTDIGNAVKPFYGDAAGAALTQKLREHILIAADLIAAAKAGDGAKVASEQARWQKNAAELATLLSKVNPRFWKKAALTSMLNEHLKLTTAEVVARLNHDWSADVAAYNRIHRHALGMADALSTGIVKQFPRRFR